MQAVFRNDDSFADSRVQGAPKAGNLDFDARVPIPISVFPSTYRSDATSVETTTTKVEGEVNLGATASSRVGREDTRFSGKEEVDITVTQSPSHRDQRTDVRVYEEKPDRAQGDRYYQPGQTTHVDITKTTRKADTYYPSGPQVNVDITKKAYTPSYAPEFQDINIDITRQRPQGSAAVEYRNVNYDVTANKGARYNTDIAYEKSTTVLDKVVEGQLDVTERDYRRRFQPNYDIEYERRRPARGTEVIIEKENVKTDKVIRNKVDMGYYDDEGQYHSFRRGVQRAVDNIVHPFSHHRHHHHHDESRTDVVIEGEARVGGGSGVRETVRVVEPRFGSSANVVTIPCNFIRIGDLLILQGRICQVIRISMSSQTGQYRYLGVDLFTKQLQEESSFVSNPEPSVIVQSMMGPVYKQYRILDIREDGQIVCMTESGDVKQGLSVIDQGNLFGKISSSYADGRGSVRALVVNDGGRELVVDYKVIHGSRL